MRSSLSVLPSRASAVLPDWHRPKFVVTTIWSNDRLLMMTRLSRIVLLLRNVEAGLQFYRDGLGLRVDAEGRSFARLLTHDGTAIELGAAER